MILIELGTAANEPVSLAEAKTWCRIERGDEDGLVGTLIRAAREAVERQTRLVLARRAFRLVVDDVPANRRIAAPCRPLGHVTALVAYGADGTPTSFAADRAAVDPRSGGGTLVVAEEVAVHAANGLDIDVTAGFEAQDAPEALRLAIRQIVAAAYEVRAAVPADLQPGLIPRAAKTLIEPYRERRL